MSKRTLLLADDSVTIQKVVNLTFADEGIDVISVGDGDSALQKLFEIKPDLVMADVHMPGPSGYEICEQIRNAAEIKDLPVVLLVGSFEPFDEEKARQVGANAYLTKPFQSIRQLVAQVSDLIHASRPGEAEELEDGGIEETLRETEDIDNLYRDSISETLEAPLTHGEAGFVDAGMDDEIIQTSYAAADEDPPNEFELPAELPDEKQAPEAPPAEREEAPAVELHRGEAETERTEEPAGVGEAEPAAKEEDLDQTVEMPFYEPANVPSEDFTPTPELQAASDDGFELDDIQLELPPVETANTVEFVTPAEAEKGAAAGQVVSISPELMEMIVQKVVEKLSEK